MKVLFVCKRHYTSKDLITDKFGRLFHLPVQLAKLGCSVAVAALDYRSKSVSENYENGTQFRSIPATVTKMPFLWSELSALARKSEPDIVIGSGDSHIGFLALILARSISARFAFDVYDYYPAFPGNRIPGMTAMFRSAITGADLVLSASNPLLKRLRPMAKHVVLIENGVDRDLFRPMDRNEARQALGIQQTTPVAGYFGAITAKRGPILIEAAHLLRARLPTLQLLIAGVSTIGKLDDTFIRYFGPLPQAQLPKLMAACDVLTIPYASDPQIEMAGPCKVAEYLACRRPVVATNVSDHNDLFDQAPQSLSEADPKSFATGIERQLSCSIIQPFPTRFDWSDIGLRLYGSLSCQIP